MNNAQNPTSLGSDQVVADQTVEVVYALPDRQVIVSIPWQVALTIEQAVTQSGLLEQFPAYSLVEGRVGVFGLRQPLDHKLEPGDRVELYRPLVMSPNDARLQRAGRSGR